MKILNKYTLWLFTVDFDIIHQDFYTAFNLKNLFHNMHPKRINFFNLISLLLQAWYGYYLHAQNAVKTLTTCPLLVQD